MKKLISIILAMMLIFSTVMVASAQEVDVAETDVNSTVYDKIANYIVTKGTNTNSGYRIPCSYKGYSCNLFYTNSGALEIRFTTEESNLYLTGNITYYKYSNTASVWLSATYNFYVADFNANFNAQTLTKDYDKKQLSMTNIRYSGDSIFKQEQLQTTSASCIIAYTEMVELHLKQKLGYGISDIYNSTAKPNNNNNENKNNEGNNNNENTNTESTPDSIQPNSSSTSDEASTASPYAVKTGVSAFDVVMMITAAGLLFVLAATVAKKKITE